MEGSRPPEFEVAIDECDLGARGVRRVVRRRAGSRTRSSWAKGSRATPRSRSGGRSACSRPGVTVLTTRVGEQVHGMTANAFMSVSLQPPLVLISIDRRARMGALMHEGTRFGVSVLEARQTGLSDRFAGRVGRRPSGGDVRGRARDAARRGCARAPRCAGRPLVLGRRPLALPRPGRVRPLRRRPAAALPRRALRAADRGPARLLAAAARAPRSDPRPRRGARVRGRRADHADRRAGLPSSCSCSRASVRVERPGLLVDSRAGRADRRDRGARPGRRAHRGHPCGRGRCAASPSLARRLLGALEADPRAAVALIEVLAARFRETA